MNRTRFSPLYGIAMAVSLTIASIVGPIASQSLADVVLKEGERFVLPTANGNANAIVASVNGEQVILVFVDNQILIVKLSTSGARPLVSVFFKLGVEVRYAVSGVPEDEIAAVAKNFRDMADAAQEGKIKSIDELIAKTRDANASVIKNVAAWEKAKTILSTKLEELSKSGELKDDMDSHIKAWRDIASGIESKK